MTLTAQLAALILAHPGISTPDLATRSGKDGHTVRGVLADLVQHGWVSRDVRRAVGRGTGGRVTLWYPTHKLRTQRYPEATYFDTAARVLTLVTEAGITLPELADTLQRPRSTIEGAVRRLTRAGKVQVVRRGRQYLVCTPLDDDGWTPPTTYIGGTRAKILGLRPGRAA